MKIKSTTHVLKYQTLYNPLLNKYNPKNGATKSNIIKRGLQRIVALPQIKYTDITLVCTLGAGKVLHCWHW
jgi:hypothetical protein